MKFLLTLSVFIMTIPIFAQAEVSNLNISDTTLQRIFDQISLPDSLTGSEEFKGEIAYCEILIELNQYLNSNGKYIIDQNQACPVDKSIIFQLNRDFIQINSIKRVDSELVAKVIWFKSNHRVLQEWIIKEKIK